MLVFNMFYSEEVKDKNDRLGPCGDKERDRDCTRFPRILTVEARMHP